MRGPMTGEELHLFLDGMDISGWGIADVEPCPEATGFRRAISLYQAYGLPEACDPALGGEYDEEALHQAILSARELTDRAAASLSDFLEGHEVPHRVVPASGQDPETLAGPFPVKLAATRAGLGWVGRSSLLVTRWHGPRVRLAALLADFDCPADEPMTESRCGGCELCVDACPYGYIGGAEWEPGLPRDALLDAFACSARMEELGKPIGRKYSCGLCLLACPYGGRGQKERP